MKKKTRLCHSARGFLRQMQMSGYELWIFVEGPFDRSFYGRLCNTNEQLKKVCYTVALAREAPGFSGDGKQALLGIYRYLRAVDGLTSTLDGKSTCILFMLDKDVDDLERTRARSPHVVYTEYYSTENYLFRFGDLSAALSAAAGLDVRSVTAQVGLDPRSWTRSAAENWRAWVEYCLLMKRLRIPGAANYRLKTSHIHNGPYGASDKREKEALLAKACQICGLPTPAFDRARDSVAKCVRRLYSLGKHDVVFNGKWYKKFLAEDAKIAAGFRQYFRAKLEDRLPACLLVTLHFSDSWTRHFHVAIDRAVEVVKSRLPNIGAQVPEAGDSTVQVEAKRR